MDLGVRFKPLLRYSEKLWAAKIRIYLMKFWRCHILISNTVVFEGLKMLSSLFAALWIRKLKNLWICDIVFFDVMKRLNNRKKNHKQTSKQSSHQLFVIRCRVWYYRLWSFKSRDTKLGFSLRINAKLCNFIALDKCVQRTLYYLLKWNDGVV